MAEAPLETVIALLPETAARSPGLVRLTVLCWLSLLSGCERAADWTEASGSTMGTYYRVVARCPGTPAGRVATISDQVLAAVDGRMSTYKEHSELSRFNRAPVGRWQPLSDELLTVLDAALQLAELSGGAFDVTVGPLVDLWGFGPPGSIRTAPPPETIASIRTRVGSRHLELDRAGGRARKHAPIRIDLSAIAKGYAVDRLDAALAEAGCPDHLVDVGGEVAARGHNRQGEAWRVGIEVPDPTRMGAVQRILLLTDAAVATSGDYRNYLDLAEKRVSHTIDPRTGRPVEHDLASVSVVHASAMWADGLATALNVLGPKEGPALAERQEIAAFFLIHRGSGFEERYTPAIRVYLSDAP